MGQHSYLPLLQHQHDALPETARKHRHSSQNKAKPSLSPRNPWRGTVTVVISSVSLPKSKAYNPARCGLGTGHGMHRWQRWHAAVAVDPLPINAICGCNSPHAESSCDAVLFAGLKPAGNGAPIVFFFLLSPPARTFLLTWIPPSRQIVLIIFALRAGSMISPAAGWELRWDGVRLWWVPPEFNALQHFQPMGSAICLSADRERALRETPAALSLLVSLSATEDLSRLGAIIILALKLDRIAKNS